MTTNQKADWTAGRWRRYPWPGGCADPRAAAWTFIEPQEEWRGPLEQSLPGYHWPDDPDRAALERILMAAPINLRPADFNALALPIDRVVALLDIATVGANTLDPHADTETGPIDEATSMSSADIARRNDLNSEALRKRLERWRKTHDEGWIEVSDRKPHEPQYLYRVGAVQHILDDLKASGGTSGERPAKKP